MNYIVLEKRNKFRSIMKLLHVRKNDPKIYLLLTRFYLNLRIEYNIILFYFYAVKIE